jgi:hypothetical protein
MNNINLNCSSKSEKPGIRSEDPLLPDRLLDHPQNRDPASTNFDRMNIRREKRSFSANVRENRKTKRFPSQEPEK